MTSFIGGISSPAPGMISSPRPGMIGGSQIKPPKPPTVLKPGKLPPVKPFPGTKTVTSSYGLPGQQPGGSQPPQYGQQQTGPTPGGQQGAGGSGLDSTYMANTAANQFKVNNQINALGLQRSQAGTTLQDTLAQLAYQQPRQQLALEQKANQMGALYSTPYDQQAGDLTNQFLGKQSAASRNYTSLADKIASQISGLQGGVPLYNAEQAAASVGRESNLAAKNPALGSPPVTARPAAPIRHTTAPRRPGLAHKIARRRK